MSIEVTPDDVRALNERIVIARWFNHADGREDVWVKGSLNEILDYFIPEGSTVVRFDVPSKATVGSN